MMKKIFSKWNTLARYKKIICIFIVTIITASIFFIANSTKEPPNKKQYTNNVQYEFDAYANDLFVSQLSADSLSLHFYLSNPTDLGFDLGKPTLGTYSFDDMTGSQKYYVQQIQYLKHFDYDKLLSTQQLTYDVLLNYFKSQLDFGDLCLCSQVLSPTTGLQAQFPVLFCEYAFNNKEDIKNYLTLLFQLKDFYAQICEFEELKAQNDCFLSSFSCDKIIRQCESFLGDSTAESNLLHTSFIERLNKITFMNESEKEQAIKNNLEIIESSVLPAYQQLITTLTNLKNNGFCKNENGLFYIKDGKEYYEYLVQTYTGSSKSVMELKADIQNKLAKDMRTMYSLLNVSPELEELIFTQKSILKNPSEILSDLEEKGSKDFPVISNLNYEIKYVDKSLENYLSPAFYLTPPIDDPTKNVIYINQHKTNENLDLYTTIAHEGIPGHMMQANYFAQTNPLPIRQVLNFSGYSEGWATYVEFLSYHYQYNHEQLAMALSCNASYSLALYSLCDIGVNFEGWTLADLKTFLTNYNIEDEAVCQSMFEAVVEEPANYLKYYVGYLEILSLREEIQAKAGSKFNLKKFHKIFLSIGPSDFDTLKKWMYQKYFNE